MNAPNQNDDTTVTDERDELNEPWHCQNCNFQGLEDDFVPTKYPEHYRICPNCSSLDVFPGWVW